MVILSEGFWFGGCVMNTSLTLGILFHFRASRIVGVRLLLPRSEIQISLASVATTCKEDIAYDSPDILAAAVSAGLDCWLMAFISCFANSGTSSRFYV